MSGKGMVSCPQPEAAESGVEMKPGSLTAAASLSRRVSSACLISVMSMAIPPTIGPLPSRPGMANLLTTE